MMIRPTDERIDEVMKSGLASFNKSLGKDKMTITRREWCTLYSCARIVRDTTEGSGEFISAGVTTIEGREDD